MNGFDLKIMRIRAGLRQYEVAAKVDLTAPRLCEIEAGRRKASDELLDRIARAIERTMKAKQLLAALEKDIQ